MRGWVFNAEKAERRRRRGCGAGRCARPRKRVAARGCARARRATGGIACKHASAHGHASAMRCIAATRHGSPLRGTLNPTEIGLTNSQWATHQADMGPFREFSCPAGTAGFRVRRGEEALKGLGRWLGGGRGTCSPDRQRGRAPSRRRRPLAQPVSQGRAKRPLCFSAPLPLCVKILLCWVQVSAAVRAEIESRQNRANRAKCRAAAQNLGRQ